jgi:hypothetical protein
MLRQVSAVRGQLHEFAKIERRYLDTKDDFQMPNYSFLATTLVVKNGTVAGADGYRVPHMEAIQFIMDRAKLVRCEEREGEDEDAVALVQWLDDAKRDYGKGWPLQTAKPSKYNPITGKWDLSPQPGIYAEVLKQEEADAVFYFHLSYR